MEVEERKGGGLGARGTDLHGRKERAPSFQTSHDRPDTCTRRRAPAIGGVGVQQRKSAISQRYVSDTAVHENIYIYRV